MVTMRLTPSVGSGDVIGMDMPTMQTFDGLAHSVPMVPETHGPMFFVRQQPTKTGISSSACNHKVRRRLSAQGRVAPGVLLDDEATLLQSVQRDEVTVNQLEGCLDEFDLTQRDPNIARRFGLASRRVPMHNLCFFYVTRLHLNNLLGLQPDQMWFSVRNVGTMEVQHEVLISSIHAAFWEQVRSGVKPRKMALLLKVRDYLLALLKPPITPERRRKRSQTPVAEKKIKKRVRVASPAVKQEPDDDEAFAEVLAHFQANAEPASPEPGLLPTSQDHLFLWMTNTQVGARVPTEVEDEGLPRCIEEQTQQASDLTSSKKGQSNLLSFFPCTVETKHRFSYGIGEVRV